MFDTNVVQSATQCIGSRTSHSSILQESLTPAARLSAYKPGLDDLASGLGTGDHLDIDGQRWGVKRESPKMSNTQA
jgi:phosphoenolpyruvate-protein kinase (PTS system EI component)